MTPKGEARKQYCPSCHKPGYSGSACSECSQTNALMIDAIREILGLDPLYGIECESRTFAASEVFAPLKGFGDTKFIEHFGRVGRMPSRATAPGQ